MPSRPGLEMNKSFVIAFVCVAVLSACAWVDLSPEGQQVEVARPGDVAGCTRIGEATARVLDKVAFMRRSREKQVRELETLARNEAAEMGGDTIMAAGDIEDGRRRFIVYRCG
jgi:hypothetical protein